MTLLRYWSCFAFLLLGACQFPPLPDLTDAPPDEDPPETTIDSSPSAIDRSTAASFIFSSNEEATFSCSLDSEGLSPCVSPYTRTVGAGAHVFRVVAIDRAGNADPTPAVFEWTVDTTSPITSLTSTPPSLDNSTTVSFEFSANEQSAFECAIDAQGFQACASPHTVASLVDGLHMFRVRATDLAGNVELSPPVYSWTIDSSTPDTQIDTGPSGTTGSQSAAFAFSSPDAGSGATFTCEIDNGGFTSCSSPVTYTGLSEGAHTFRVRVRDAVGNVDPTPATRNWTIDLTGPETMIVSGPSGSVASTSAMFMFSSNEPGTFECKLDSGTYSLCPANHVINGLAQGMHVLLVRAIDSQGNPDTSPAQRSWIVDTVMPTVTISAPAEGSTTNGTVQVTFVVDENATSSCRVDGGSFASCSSGVSYLLASGAHTADVRATDAAGNTGSATRNWTVDASPPETSITAGPSGSVASTSASVSFSSPDTSATFQCNLDAAGFAPCSSPHSLSGLMQGAHTLQVRAVDSVGNVDLSPAVRSWTVDTVPPDTMFMSGPAAVVRVAQATFDLSSDEASVTYQCSLDGANFASCPDPYSITVTNGAHQMRAVAVDAAGNMDASPASHSWSVDLPNIVFVTAFLLDGTLGGLAGADAYCQMRAQTAGLAGTYRAWLSTTTVDAIDRLGSASGWQRVDGKPVVNTPADLVAGRMYYPINRTELGSEVINRQVFSATTYDGTRDISAGTCADWTSINDPARTGWTQGTSGRFTSHIATGVNSSTCASSSIYCFGVDYTTTVSPPAATSRKIFITSSTWTPGGGLVAADNLCAAEAAAAALPGNFKALLGTSSQGATSRFQATGAAWSRVDGPALTSTAAELVNGPGFATLTSPNVTASGLYISGANGADEVWGGGPRDPTSFTCSDWTSSSSSETGYGGVAATLGLYSILQSLGTPCNQARRLICLQE